MASLHPEGGGPRLRRPRRERKILLASWGGGEGGLLFGVVCSARRQGVSVSVSRCGRAPRLLPARTRGPAARPTSRGPPPGRKGWPQLARVEQAALDPRGRSRRRLGVGAGRASFSRRAFGGRTELASGGRDWASLFARGRRLSGCTRRARGLRACSDGAWASPRRWRVALGSVRRTEAVLAVCSAPPLGSEWWFDTRQGNVCRASCEPCLRELPSRLDPAARSCHAFAGRP